MTPAPLGLADRVAAATNDVHAWCARHGRGDLAEQLSAESRRWQDAETFLVVLGETQRGKSAVVNALLGHPGTVPEGAAEATTTFIAVRHGDWSAAVFTAEGEGRREIVPDELEKWVTDGERAVMGAEVRVPAPLLEGALVLVDTPGFGAVGGGRERQTLALLDRADALLFVTGAGAPVTGPELELFRKASRRIATTLVAVTGIDRNRGWRRVVEDDEEILREHGAALPLFPVSPRMLRLAAERGNDELRDESGFPALADAIRERVLGRQKLVRLGNLARLARAVVDEVDRALYARYVAADPAAGADMARRLDEARKRVEDDRNASNRALRAVADQFSLLRDRAAGEIDVGGRDLLARYDQDLARWHKDPLAFEHAVADDLRATAVEVENLVDEEVARIVSEVADELQVSGVELDSGGLTPGARRRGGSEDADPPAGGDPFGRLRLLSAAASSGAGAMWVWRLAATPEMMAVAAVMGMGVVLGMVASLANLRSLRGQRDAQQLRQNLRSVVDATRREMVTRLREQLLVTQRAVEDEVRAAGQARATRLQAELNELLEVARRSAAEREELRGAINDSRRAAADLRHRLEELEQEAGSRP